LLAADQVMLLGPTVVAGYPWFGAWSRDTMTSYEGPFLEPARIEEGRTLLRRSAATLSEGMLARTADTGTLEYNTADGTLWFPHAVEGTSSAQATSTFVAELAAPLIDVVDAHVRGTRYGIAVDPSDGLLT
jgi:predicted glycogen debranching enzyme